MEFFLRINEEVADIAGFGEEEEGSKKVDATCDCAKPPEPFERELLADPTVDDGTSR